MPNGVLYRDADAAGLAFTCRFTLCVGRARLPAQTLLHTEWFHADCLASYYGVAPLSEEHWRILENFIRAAGEEHGINMLLTPVFTPPLDTAVNGERLTVQLVDVRTPAEYARGHIEGFVNLPLDGLRGLLDKLDPAKPVYVHCHSGLRSYIACRLLTGEGFTCYNLAGGYRLWAAIQQAQTPADHPCYFKN